MKTELRTKRIVRVSGEVQLPIKVGEELSYISGNIMYWTDRVKKILEIAEEYVRVERAPIITRLNGRTKIAERRD